MGIVKGLSSINSYNADLEAKRKERDRPKTEWFKIDDKQSVNVVFLQELDAESAGFSEKNDLGFLAVEHVNPENWKRKAVCTSEDEGACYACDRHKEDWKAGWKQKTRLYINVLVDDSKNDPYVAVMSQSVSGQSITPTLIEYAGDDGTITDKWFSVKRNGEGTDTSYTLRGKSAHGLNVEDYELFDLEQVVRQIPFAQQEAHYLDGQQAPGGNVSSEADNSSATSSTTEW